MQATHPSPPHPPLLGRWLKRLRAQQDLTQEALAELANCSVQTISFFESGKRRPSVGMAEHLAQILQVPADEVEAFIQCARAPLADRSKTVEEPVAVDPAAEPPPRASAHRQPLPPISATDLLGRQAEIQVLTRLLVQEKKRLVSIVAMGGMGKTRLALHLAHALCDQYVHGATFVLLAPINRASEIPAAIANALGEPLPKAAAQIEPLDQLLHGREMLLVLDNFEHLLTTADGEAAVMLVQHIIERHADITILVTTRERLRIHGEQIFELAGLSISVADQPAALGENEAVLLFVQRASQVSPGFALSAANRTAVRQICTLVDGIPLAIELAAAWSHILTPSEIVKELNQDVDFLNQGTRNAPRRHRSLRALFDHSWALLTEEERSVLAWLSIFWGGFTRQAAQSVAGATVSLLSQLADKSLIRVFMQPSSSGEYMPRYSFHNLLRLYLQERLAERAESAAASHQHASYFAELAETHRSAFTSSNSAEAFHALSVEQENIRAALRWTVSEGHEPLLGLKLASSLGRYWYLGGFWQEGRDWLACALAFPVGAAPGSQRATAHALVSLGELYRVLEENEAAVDMLERSVELWRTLNDAGQLAWSLFMLGSARGSQGEYDQAEIHLRESLDLYRSLGEEWATATVLNQLGGMASSRGNYVVAQRLLMESLPILRRQHGTGEGVAVALNLLGRVVLVQGNAPQAIHFFEEALDLTSGRQNREGEAWTLLNLGLAYLAAEQWRDAQEVLHTNLALNEQLGRKGGVMAAKEGLAAVYAAQGDFCRAEQLLAEAEELRIDSGQQLTAYELELHQRTERAVQAGLIKVPA